MEGYTVKKGTVLFREGDREDCMYALMAGSVRIVSGLGTPGEKELTRLTGGDYFGEMGMLEREPRSASAIAADDSRVMRITPENFEEFFTQRPEKVLSILQRTSHRLRELSGQAQTAAAALSRAKAAEAEGKPLSKDLKALLKRLAS